MEQEQLKSYLVFGLDWIKPDFIKFDLTTRVTAAYIRREIYPLIDSTGYPILGKYCAISPVSQSKLNPEMPLELFSDEPGDLGFIVAVDYYNALASVKKENFIGVVPITFLEPHPSRYLVLGGYNRSIPQTLIGRVVGLSPEEEKQIITTVALKTDKLNAVLRGRIGYLKSM